MLYLIVPPIIIILAIAILIIFLVRILPSENNRKHIATEDEKKAKKKLKNSKKIFQKKGSSTRKRIKKTLEATTAVLSEKREKLKNTEGITRNRNAENVVSLRKKSMISDKIDDGEDRDVQEVALMREIESDPQNSKKYERLGDYYMEHEKFNDARECYKYVLRLDPRHKRAQVAMKNLDRVLR